MKRTLICLLLSLLAITACKEKSDKKDSADQEESGTKTAAAITEGEDFTLLDHEGRARTLSRQKEAPAVVLIATQNGSETIREAKPLLQPAFDRFKQQGVVFWMINSNPADSRESLAKEFQELGLQIPILKDAAQLVTFGLGFQHVGEVVCLSPKDFKIFYRGAIDEAIAELPSKKSKSKGPSNYLENALAKFVLGQKVEPAVTQPKESALALSKPDGTISYANQIVPLIEKHCLNCHSKGNIGPFAFSNYEKVRGMSAMTREVLLSQRMPPWHADPHVGTFSNARGLKPEEALTFVHWIDQGCPKGEDPDPLVAKASALESDWPMGPPDVIVRFPKEENIPATGVLEYRHIMIMNPLPTNAWLRAAVIKPGNKKVVHHAVVVNGTAQDVAGGRNGRASRPGLSVIDGFFTDYVPGLTHEPFPEGTGKQVLRGSIFLFQMHYTTTGKEETDITEMGLYLSKEKPKEELLTRSAFDTRFRIPAGSAEHVTEAAYKFTKDSLLYEMSPHMHLRGSWFTYEAVYPDKTREVLLSVPRYDFKWQHLYRLAEPKRMPAGTVLIARGAHDNSPNNPDNPDPQKDVRFGDQTFDEMFIGYINYVEVKGGFKKTTASLQ